MAAINATLEPMRARRAEFDRPGAIEESIVAGTQRVREETRETLRLVRKAMGLSGVWNRMRRRAERRQTGG